VRYRPGTACMQAVNPNSGLANQRRCSIQWPFSPTRPIGDISQVASTRPVAGSDGLSFHLNSTVDWISPKLGMRSAFQPLKHCTDEQTAMWTIVSPTPLTQPIAAEVYGVLQVANSDCMGTGRCSWWTVQGRFLHEYAIYYFRIHYFTKIRNRNRISMYLKSSWCLIFSVFLSMNRVE
jgi:hypothetical protein